MITIDKKDLVASVLDRSGYSPVPNELYEVDGLCPAAKYMWLYVYSKKPEWRSSRNNIARNLGMGVNTVVKYLEDLESLGMIVVDKTNEHYGWRFFFPLVSTWTDKYGNVEKRLAAKLVGEWETGGSKQIQGVSKQIHTKDLLLPQENLEIKEDVSHKSLPEDCFLKEAKGAKQPTASCKKEPSDRESFSTQTSSPEMTESHPRQTDYASPVRTPPSIKTIIQEYISGIGNPEALVDKRSRTKHLVDIVDTIQAYGYSKSEATKALATLTPYVVPNAVKSVNKKKEWAADLERNWEIIVRTAYAPAQPVHPDMINKEANTESLEVDVGDIFKRSK